MPTYLPHVEGTYQAEKPFGKVYLIGINAVPPNTVRLEPPLRRTGRQEVEAQLEATRFGLCGQSGACIMFGDAF